MQAPFHERIGLCSSQGQHRREDEVWESLLKDKRKFQPFRLREAWRTAAYTIYSWNKQQTEAVFFLSQNNKKFFRYFLQMSVHPAQIEVCSVSKVYWNDLVKTLHEHTHM